METGHERNQETLNQIFNSRRPIKSSNIDAFNAAIAKEYMGTEDNGTGQYYLDWRYNLKDEKSHIEDIADEYGLSVEFQSDDGYFEVYSSRKPIKSGYAPYYNDSTISEKGKKAYEWLCDFVGQNLELGHHPWYGPTVYLDINKMNITPEMLEEINNKMWEMDGHNSITAQSGEWGYGNVYEVTFDQNYNVQSSRRPIKSGYKLPHGETKSEYQLRENFQHMIERAYLDSNGKLNKMSIENAFTEAMEDILEKDPDFFNFYNDEE